MIKAPDHVQVAMPAGEKRGRDFYSSPLGLKELEKAAALAGRGGAWFALPDRGNRTSASRSPSSLAGMPTRRSFLFAARVGGYYDGCGRISGPVGRRTRAAAPVLRGSPFCNRLGPLEL